MLQTSPQPSPKAIAFEYATWFDDRIDQFAEEHKSKYESVLMFKRRNGFFITISFDHVRRNQRNKSSELIDGPSARSEMDTFADLYNFLCRDLISRNYHRPSFHPLKPLAIGCLDMNGSRYWRSIGKLENPHIHSIWIFTDQTISGFKKLLADENWVWSIKERFGLRELDIQPLNHDHRNQQGPSKVSSYTAKFVAHNNHGLTISDDLRIFPTQGQQTH